MTPYDRLIARHRRDLELAQSLRLALHLVTTGDAGGLHLIRDVILALDAGDDNLVIDLTDDFGDE